MEKRILSCEEISVLCMELSFMLQAGAGTGDSLALLAQDSDSGYKELLLRLAEQADMGMPLSVVMRNSERFPVYVSGLVEMGEKAGHLEEALMALSKYYEYRTRLDRRIRSAILYPAVMLVLMLLVIAVLLIKVLPIFDDVYRSLGGRLTGVAGGLLALGHWLDKIMPVLWVGLVVLAVVFALFATVSSFRERILSFWKRILGDKGIFRLMNTARLAQALSMGVSSGLALGEAVGLATGVVEDVPEAKKRCMDCCQRLENGEEQGNALKKSGVLPSSFCHLLDLGLKSGSVERSMEKIAGDLSENSEAALENMVSRVEPALVLVCSILVGLILLSVMMPLMHIMAAIG